MTKIAVVVGSTRQGRISDKLATWVAEEVKKESDVEIVDLKDYPMPFFEEAASPRYNPNRTPSPEVKKWLDKVAEFDGYVLVTPEYNRSTSAVLKNALDTLDYQMDNKPVTIVAHGSTGGAQAVATLRIALPGVGALGLPKALFFSDGVRDAIDEAGVLKEELQDNPYGPQANLKAAIDDLKWYADVLSAARK
jgi:NAD(P)H-dependent FMN reductase